MRTSRPIIRVRRCLVAMTLAFFACVAADLGAQAARSPLKFRPLEFETIEGRKRRVDAEEATLTVPADHAKPDGATYGIHVVRFKATSANPGPPIVYLAGGPGGSAARSIAGDRFDLFMSLRAQGDVIAVAQRGAFGATPYSVCPSAWSQADSLPSSPAALVDAMRPWAAACVNHWQELGVDLSTLNTEASADDLELLRRGLGVERISIVGISYGTHLGLAFMRRHPGSVHRAVLAGVEGPDATLKLPGDVERALVRLDSLIAADRDMATVPRLIPTVQAALARLREAPVTVTVRDPSSKAQRAVTVGPLDLQLTVFENMGERDDIERIPAALIPLARGDFSEIALAALSRRTNRRAIAMSSLMDCASGASPERLARIAREAAVTTLGDVNATFPGGCTLWPYRDLGADFRAPIRSDAPTLFISGDLDVRTPTSNADELMSGFPNGRQLIIRNGGHDDDLLIASPRIGAAIAGFLGGATPPATVELSKLSFKRRR